MFEFPYYTPVPLFGSVILPICPGFVLGQFCTCCVSVCFSSFFLAFFLMRDVSSVYDLFDPKLREISATHHFMTRTTHIVCFKYEKEIGLSYHIQIGNRPKNHNINEGMI